MQCFHKKNAKNRKLIYIKAYNVIVLPVMASTVTKEHKTNLV